MARIRTLKPEFWQDEKLGLCPPIVRLVFLGLISQSDDAGRLFDNPKMLDGLLFPATSDTCAPALGLLAKLGRILRYQSSSGQRLIQIVGWERHQKVKNPSVYNLPAPSEADTSRVPSQADVDSVLTALSVDSTAVLRRLSPESNAPIPDLYIPDPRSPTEAKASDVPSIVEKPVEVGEKPADNPMAYLMPILRKYGFEADATDGSIIKALLKKGVRVDDIEAAIIGLSYMRDNGKLNGYGFGPEDKLSMRILYAASEGKKPIWTDACAEYYRQQPKEKRPHGMKQTGKDLILKALAG